MAELVLKIGDNQGYKDGDVLCAFNDKRIHCTHAQHVCFPRDRNRKDLEVMFFEKTHQYKFQRTSEKAINKINLFTLSLEVISNVPNANGEYIDVQSFIDRRKRNPKHFIFGTKGREYWYGGNKNFSDIAINNIWTEIETRTVFKKVDFSLWPLTVREKKQFLDISVNNFDDLRSSELVEQIKDIEGRVIKKRKYRIDYKNSLDFTTKNITDILDISKEIDFRGLKKFDDKLITKLKI